MIDWFVLFDEFDGWVDEGAGWAGRRTCSAVQHPVLTTAVAILEAPSL